MGQAREKGVKSLADDHRNGTGRWPPWSRIQGLNEMTREAGVDFDQFVSMIRDQASIREMSEHFGVSEATVASLQDHFMHYGMGSVQGGD